MSQENELLEPLATEAGQDRIVAALNGISSLQYAVRAENAATTAVQKADEAAASATSANNSATTARNWATKMDGYVAQETITIPAEIEGEEDTTETINLYSSKYYAALAEDYFNNLVLDTEPTEDSAHGITSGAVYDALQDVYTEINTKQDELTFDTVPTQNSGNPIESGAVYTALASKQDTLTFDDAPTQNSVNPVKSSGIYTAIERATPNVVKLKTVRYGSSITCDSEYYNDSDQLYYTQLDRTYYKQTTVPAACAMVIDNNNWVYGLLVSNIPEGVQQRNSYYNTVENYGGTFVKDGVTYYWSASSANYQSRPYSSIYPTLSEKYATQQSAAEALFDIAHIGLGSSFIEEELFNPTGYTITSGSTISDNKLQSLINGYRPIKVNGETYYFIKLNNGTYYYEGESNTITINSSWVITITPKETIPTLDSVPTQNSTNGVTSGGVYTALQNIDIDVDDEITENSTNPVTSAAIYEALQNFTPSGGGGGAGNTSGITREELWSGSWSSGSISLSSPIAQYDLIEIIYNSTGGGRTQNYSRFISSQDLLKYTSESSHTTVYGYGEYVYDFYVQPPNVLVRNSYEGRNYTISEIYGIKFSKNLSEQMYSNVLYENSSGWSSGNITLNDSLDNYDFIEVQGKLTDFQSMLSMYCNINQINNDNKFLYCGYSDKYMYVSKISSTELSAGTRKEFSIYKIIGYKLAKGGYSGIVSDARMTVKRGTYTASGMVSSGIGTISISFDSPMPDTNYTVLFAHNGDTNWWMSGALSVRESQKTVNGFTIDYYAGNNIGNTSTGKYWSFDWIAIRPNSYTREGMVEDVLFSNASGVNSGTINLSGNISDYDLIMFETNSSGNSSSLNQNRSVFTASSLSELTGNTSLGNCILLTGYGTDYLKLTYINDNTLNAYESSALKLLKIVGIKFGRYVSGVAIDNTVTSSGTGVPSTSAVYTALQNVSSALTIDSTPTSGSSNLVSSGGVYTALQGVGGGGSSNASLYTLNTASYNAAFDCDSGYYIASQDATLFSQGGEYFIKQNALPAIAGYTTNENNRPVAVLVSLDPDACKGYSNRGSNWTYSGTLTYLGKTWYYVGVSTSFSVGSYSVSTSLQSIDKTDLPTTYSNADLAQQLLTQSNAYLTTADIQEDLFNPTNQTISSGSTISNNMLQSLIYGYRPIKINGETYYFVKLDSGIYYYEGQSNTITIDSSWEITITAKSSGGSSVTVDSSITQNGTNPVEGGAIYTALSGKADTSTTLNGYGITDAYTKTEVDTALLGKGDVTTNTDQNITGTKTFVGSKKVGFKQSTANDKLGFTLYGNTGTERGYLEFNPTNTVDGVTGLMTLGNYATSAAALTQVGFRRYSNISGASGAYNLLMPMVADARTPFSLTTTYTNFYLPLGFTDGTNVVKTAKSGMVDISPLLASLEARVAALEGNT